MKNSNGEYVSLSIGILVARERSVLEMEFRILMKVEKEIYLEMLYKFVIVGTGGN